MKLFLTSGGLTTDTLRAAFRSLLPPSPRVAFVPTAARLYQDISWLDADVNNISAAGVEVTRVDISLAPKREWMEVFEAAHAICFGGGNT